MRVNNLPATRYSRLAKRKGGRLNDFARSHYFSDRFQIANTIQVSPLFCGLLLFAIHRNIHRAGASVGRFARGNKTLHHKSSHIYQVQQGRAADFVGGLST
jgi:hypothetical protein